MARSPSGRMSRLIARVLSWWHRIPIRIQGRITVGLPLLAVLLSAGMAVVGNHERVAIETDIQRKFQMTAALSNLTTTMVDAETGMRGYLLTGQDSFLEPFDQANAELPGAIARLNALAEAEPGERPRQDKVARVASLQTLSAEQLVDLDRQREFVVSGRLVVSDAELRRSLSTGKGLMDRIRSEVAIMQGEELQLLNDRVADINAIRVRDYVSVVVALIVALGTRFLAWYLFRTGVLVRVERLTENARSLRRGEPTPFPPTGKKDKLGELEHEIARFAG